MSVEPLKILFLCNSPHSGGAEIWVRRAAVALRERGHDVVVASPPGGALAETVPPLHMSHIPLDAGPVLNRRSALSFTMGWRRNRRRMLETIGTARRRYGVEVIHVGLTAEKLLVGSVSPLPLAWTEHGPLPSLFIRSPLFRIYRRAGLAASVMHCVSESTASHFHEIGFPRDHLRSIQVGLRFIGGTVERARELRSELGFGSDHVVVGSVGRLVWVKGLETFLAAAARLAPVHENVRFLVVGDGPLRSELERRARRLGLDGRLVFTGHRSDVPALLRVMDIHVAPSVTEGFGMAVLEAMHAAIPSVATAVGGHPEMIRDGETGFLTSVGDSDGLADRVERLASDPALRASLGWAARARAEGVFSHATFVERLESLFAEAAASPAPGTVLA